jgi:hypothetical protein
MFSESRWMRSKRTALYVRQSFTTPGIYIKTTRFALHDQVAGSEPEWEMGSEASPSVSAIVLAGRVSTGPGMFSPQLCIGSQSLVVGGGPWSMERAGANKKRNCSTCSNIIGNMALLSWYYIAI